MEHGSVADDRGQVTLWSTVWIALALSLAVGVVWFGQRLQATGHAQAVADAVALAGATSGRPRADAIAAHNGAAVITFEETDGVVRVVVEAAGARAQASATAEP